MNQVPTPSGRKRVRLSPEQRSRQILESALAEFSRNGFAATRIEDIASGAGLSKSGFYAHFQSKEEIFEALLTRTLAASEIVPFRPSDTVVSFVERFIEQSYSRMQDPGPQTMVRLLLAEASRIPELIGRWRREVMGPVLSAQQDELRRAVRRGQLLPGPLLEDVSLAYAPILYWIVSSMIPGESGANLDRQREAHRLMLLALLKAP